MWRKTFAWLTLPLLFVTSENAAAQVRFGPQVAYGDDIHLAVGGRVTFNTRQPLIAGAGEIHGLAAFDYFLDCDNCSYFEITPGAYIPITVGGIGPYVGAGLNIGRFSVDDNVSPGFDASNTDIGLALFGGLQFPFGGQTAMAEARFAIGGSEQLVVTVAWLFGGGGGNDSRR